MACYKRDRQLFSTAGFHAEDLQTLDEPAEPYQT
jgi:hypothetical protein